MACSNYRFYAILTYKLKRNHNENLCKVQDFILFNQIFYIKISINLKA